jgi:hypothetical protein
MNSWQKVNIYSTMIRNEKDELFIQWNLTSWSISAARDFTALTISAQILWILYGSLIFLPWSVLSTLHYVWYVMVSQRRAA